MTATATPASEATRRIPGVDTQRRPRRRLGPFVKKSAVYILLTIASVGFILPIVWIVLSSFKPTQDIISSSPFSFSFGSATLANFRTLFKLVPVWTYFKNSLIYSVGSTVGTVFSATLVGYGFARSKTKASATWFTLALSTLMIPFTVTVFPQYAVYQKLHWINTFAPLIIPSFLGVGGSTLFIFLMRQFFMGIPEQLEEAAYLDGCSPFRAFRSVVLPLCKPAIVTVVIFQFVFSWNDFFGPLVYLNSSRLFTLPLGAATLSSAYGSDYGPLLCMCLISVLPLIVVFVIFQRYFVRSLVNTGFK
jgi:multiple sugar transport system permease protein